MKYSGAARRALYSTLAINGEDLQRQQLAATCDIRSHCGDQPRPGRKSEQLAISADDNHVERIGCS